MSCKRDDIHFISWIGFDSISDIFNTVGKEDEEDEEDEDNEDNEEDEDIRVAAEQ